MVLPHLKLGKTGNAKYRHRVTSPQMQTMLGKAAVEWSLKTRDPIKIVEAWKEAHARFQALEAKASGQTIKQTQWDVLSAAAVKHGLAPPDANKIGPVDAELEAGKFKALTEAILAEADALSPQQLAAKFANNPPTNAFMELVRVKIYGVERPPIPLSDAVKMYLKDREGRRSYLDLVKQVELAVSGLEAAMDKPDPPIASIDRPATYAYRVSLTARDNGLGTVRRRITTIKAVLNAADKRFDLGGWRNPFNGIELPEDDGEAGEEKRRSLTLEDIRKIRDKQGDMNPDARDIWHLMMFTGLSPDEARGLQWSEVFLETPRHISRCARTVGVG